MSQQRNQETSASVPAKVTMDTRKFLSAINGSAQAQIAFFEDAVRRLGEQQGAAWKLTALQSTKLIIEDTTANEFLIADHVREKGGRVKINNIVKLELHEDTKPEMFEQACFALVESIEKSSAKDIDAAYNRVAASRFRSTAVPSSGVVKTKDGVIRQVTVHENKSLGRSLAEEIVELLADKITIGESGGVEGTFSKDKSFDLGITELTTRKLVAHNMQEAALSAYRSPNFQTMIESVAGLVSQDKLTDAVGFSSQFLKEHQEFCLLNGPQWEKLIGETLATKACFNEDLVRDTATLMRKTNLKVNREELIDAWRKTAEKTEHPIMLENVDLLAKAENFEQAYEQFLPTILEVTETDRNAAAAGLRMLADKIKNGGEAGGQTVQKIDELINNIETRGDTASIHAAMEALEAAGRSLKLMEAGGLNDFDAMPGSQAGESGPAEVGAAAGSEAKAAEPAGVTSGAGATDKPIVVTVGIDPKAIAAAAAPPAAPAPAPGGEGGEGEGGFDLDSLGDLGDLGGGGGEGGEKKEEGGLGGGAPKGGAGAGGGGNLLASKEPAGPAISESLESDLLKEFAKFEGVKAEIIQPEAEPVAENKVEPEVVDEENPDDPYRLPKGMVESDLNRDYHTLVEDAVGTQDVEEFKKEIATNPNAAKDPLAAQAAAEAYIRKNQRMAQQLQGVTDPKAQQQMVTDLSGQLLAQYQQAQGAPESVQDTGTVISEGQYKWQRFRGRLGRQGFKRSSINKLDEGKLKWLEREEKAVLGEYKGVKFVLDNSQAPLVLLSENGAIEVPVPAEMVGGALFLSEASDKEASIDEFVEWLDSNIESLRVTESNLTGKPAEQPAEPQGREATVDEAGKPEGVQEGSDWWKAKQAEMAAKKSGKKEEPAAKEEPKEPVAAQKPEEPKKEEPKPVETK